MLLSVLPSDAALWSADWVWGCPLVVFTLIIHVVGLAGATRYASTKYNRHASLGTTLAIAVIILAAISVFATVLHAVEAGVWAITYCFLGALPDLKSAMLYSLGAMTTYGHEAFHLAPKWQMMGSIEALNGWLLFGLSSAFLFGLIQNLRSIERHETHD